MTRASPAGTEWHKETLLAPRAEKCRHVVYSRMSRIKLHEPRRFGAMKAHLIIALVASSDAACGGTTNTPSPSDAGSSTGGGSGSGGASGTGGSVSGAG